MKVTPLHIAGPESTKLQPECQSGSTIPPDFGCDFGDDLSEPARPPAKRPEKVTLCGRLSLGITEGEWIRLIRSIGRMSSLRHLDFTTRGTPNTIPMTVLTECLVSASHLRKLEFDRNVVVRGSRGELMALARAAHGLVDLEEFSWKGMIQVPTVMRWTVSSYEPILRALVTGCHSIKVIHFVDENEHLAGPETICTLLRRRTLREVELGTADWRTVVSTLTDPTEIAQSSIRVLRLRKRRARLSDCREIGRLLKTNHRLEQIEIYSGAGFSHEMGMAIATGLSHNTNLHVLTLEGGECATRRGHTSFSTETYEAFNRVSERNYTSIRFLNFKPLSAESGPIFEAEERAFMWYYLNSSDRRMLVRRVEDRSLWLSHLAEWTTGQLLPDNDDNFSIACIYTLLRSNPNLCMRDI